MRPLRAALLTLALGCGARTGLPIPDASLDAPTEDVFVRFDACVAGRFGMIRRSARLLFVIDRSGSMLQPLEMGAMTSRWQATVDALRETLPRFEDRLAMGALTFPRTPDDDVAARYLQACQVQLGSGITVDVAPRNAAAMSAMLERTSPVGATPTGAAVRRATEWLRAHDARGVASYLVLLTDGIPNCNAAIEPSACECLDPATMCGGERGRLSCLDDDGTVRALEDARRAGVVTYVIGIDGSLEARFQGVLDRMADAGGRPNAGSPRYSSIRNGAQLLRTFEGIQRSVALCSYVTPSRPDDPDAIDVDLDGARVPRDPTRREGWEWSDRDYGELTFYGRACEVAQRDDARVQATVRCAER
ncbi:MAG: vWA domain-containing protein [Polyangiales bacterium]